MPVLGDKVFKLNDDMNIDEDDEDDEKQPLAVVKQKYISQSTESTPKKTPRAVVARPPTSHGSKKKTPVKEKKTSVKEKKTPVKKKTPMKEKKKPPLIFISDSSSSDDEVILSKIATPTSSMKQSERTPKRGSSIPSSSLQTPKKTPKSPSKLRSPTRSSSCNPFSPTGKQKRFQRFCSMLTKLWAAVKDEEQENPKRAKKLYNSYAQMVVTTLQRPEMERIPDPEIRADILKRYGMYIDRKKMKNMTEEERKKYLKDKSAAQREQEKQKLENERRRYEDTTLSALPLPSPQPVKTMDAFSSSQYGDILMVVNFIRSYASFLTPKEEPLFTPDQFSSALVDPECGTAFVSKILMILLHALIHDEVAPFRQEMGVKLADLELNSSTVGELARLCLRRQRDSGDDDDGDNESKSHTNLSTTSEAADDELLEEISGNDLEDLSPSTKVKLLVALSNRLLTSVAVENYIVDIQQQYSDAVTERNAATQDYNKFTKENKQETEELTKPEPVANVEEHAEENEDLASKVKKRRLMADERAKREAEERALEAKRREKQMAERKIRNRLDTANRKLEEITALKKSVSRIEPLGTDRDHNRYWYFGKWLPFIFVEKGWTPIDALDDSSAHDGSKEPSLETTFPRRGPNEWYCYGNLEDIDNLINSLCTRGYRESALKERLSVCYAELKAAAETNKSAVTAVDSKDDASLAADFKAKLLQLEASIRAGGLGGVNDFDAWRSRMDSAVTVADMGALLLEVSGGVRPTLLCGILARDLTQTAEKGADEGKSEKDSNGMRQWRESIGQCKTWSRLHVLMSMLRCCIRWDRSLEHAKCRICRRKQDDELALVCDICNDVYHMYCLRPPLKKLPEGEWYCKSCKPRPAPKARKVQEPEIDQDDDDESGSDKQADQASDRAASVCNGNCVVCGEGEFDDQSDELITCSTCSSSFHCNCHTPPLRYKPRSSWRCSHCLSGRQIRSTRLRSKVERDGIKPEWNSASKALLSFHNRDLFDDEASSADSASVSSDRKRKHSN